MTSEPTTRSVCYFDPHDPEAERYAFACEDGLPEHWARHPDSGIENLVVADQRCNGSKRDFLAAGEHVDRWTQRFVAPGGSIREQLIEIARRAGWDRQPEQTLNVARTIYSRLPDDVRLWLRTREFVPVVAQRTRLLGALGG